MICLLDVIAWPFFVFGGAFLFLIVGVILAIVSTVALMIVMCKRQKDAQKKTEQEKP